MVQSYSKDSQYLNCILKPQMLLIWVGCQTVSAQQNGSSLPIKFDKGVRSGTEFKFVLIKFNV
jgi:hypothetical protein